MEKQRVLIAMSGGVDSSVAAWLTLQTGTQCAGAIMELLPCKCADIADAKAVAERLSMDFHVFSMEDAFRESVMDPFVSVYESGLTPNPCVVCNRRIKFGAFLDKALELGFTHVATGHYARVIFDGDSSRYVLKKAADSAKDQSYFLCQLTQHQLAHTLFPLGELTKDQSRAIAEKQGLVTARKRDSQDVCFIPDGDYLNFLQSYTGKTYENGDFLDLSGKKIGTHKGAVAYTLGQRKGLGIAMGEPVYVCAKDMAANTVTVGRNEDLLRSELIAEGWNWIAMDPPTAPIRVMVKARSRMVEQPATFYPAENRLVFDEPQRALTPGQALALYDGDTVIAGATITAIL